MAVTQKPKSGGRRILYGLNVFIATVLMIVLVVIVIRFAGQYGRQYDWTSAQVNSLSPRTLQLLEGLGAEIRITGLYTTALKDIQPIVEARQKRVADLVDLYETYGGGRVVGQMIDPAEGEEKVVELLKRLAEKPAYLDEAAPHIELLAAFPDVNKQLHTGLQDELATYEELSARDPRLAQVQGLRDTLQTWLQRAQQTEEDIRKLTEGEIPAYGAAAGQVESYLSDSAQVLDTLQNWMIDKGSDLPGLGAEARQFFSNARARYAPLAEVVAGLLEKASGLEEVELETLYAELNRGQTILVESDDKAIVLSQNEVWTAKQPGAPESPDGDPLDFSGEQAISSAILRLTQAERTAVVFTRFGGEALLEAPFNPQNPMAGGQAPFGVMNELLKKENFITAEWDVQSQETPPSVPDASRTIYVVFPPEPPAQPNPMRPSPTPAISAAQKQKIYDAVDQAGLAIFMTSWMPPTNQFMATPQPYDFNEYLKSTWGVGVRDAFLALEFMPNPQQEGLWGISRREALVTAEQFEYTEHPIGKPLEALPAALQLVAPLEILPAEQRPAGETIEEVIRVPQTEDVWAISDINRLQEDLRTRQGTRRREEDLAPPFPLAVAATKTIQPPASTQPVAAGAETGAREQRLVVFASARFASDALANASSLMVSGGRLVLARMFPGNTDLFINALHWLTQDSERISVGPQRADVTRLKGPKGETEQNIVNWLVAGIWPGLALVIGGLVWLARRR